MRRREPAWGGNQRRHYSFPVGKVETITLYPLDFEEYLWARGKELLSKEIRAAYGAMEPLPDALHQEAIELYREYLIIGGMPACINAFLKNGSFLDVLELDAASNNGVDQVRALRDEAIYAPANVKKRVYIVDEVHMLSTPAFNALLKILEEPPEHLMFILATTELHKCRPPSSPGASSSPSSGFSPATSLPGWPMWPGGGH